MPTLQTDRIADMVSAHLANIQEKWLERSSTRVNRESSCWPEVVHINCILSMLRELPEILRFNPNYEFALKARAPAYAAELATCASPRQVVQELCHMREAVRRQLPEDEEVAELVDFLVSEVLCCYFNDLDKRHQHTRQAAEAECVRRRYILEVVGHELRSPLAPIFTWIDMLDQRLRQTPLANDPVLVQACTGLHRSARTLKRLVDDLNDYAALSHEKLSINHSLVNLVALLNECAASLASRAEAAKLQLTLELPDQPIHVKGDETRLQQCVLNLLNNAVKFTPSEGRVNVRLGTGGDRATIEVSDSGVGIAPEKLNVLFTPFQQAEQCSRTGCLGLGLAIVKSLVELHSGQIEANSDGPGKGTRFRISLPLASAVQ